MHYINRLSKIGIQPIPQHCNGLFLAAVHKFFLATALKNVWLWFFVVTVFKKA
jgi:hypothetical protein